MIKLTRADGREIIINAELIQYVESTPDTIITLTTNQKLMVKEKAADLINKVIEYKQKVNHKPLSNQ
ncbi:MAG: flagellar FlbD family protein [Candidatus Omnitrophota bacterium]